MRVVSFTIDSGIEIYLAHNKEKIAVVERFFRTLKMNIYRHMAAVSSIKNCEH